MNSAAGDKIRFSLKEGETEARERLRAFWAGNSLGRPALLMTCPAPDWNEPAREWHGTEPLKQREMLPAYQQWQAENQLAGLRFLAEAMPDVHLRWGCILVTLAAFAGGDYDFNEGNNAWIHPIPDLYRRPLPSFNPTDPLTIRIETLMRAMDKAAHGCAYVNPPIMLDALTTLSLFRGVENLCVELVSEPETVKRWAHGLTELYVDIYEHFYRMAVAMGYGPTCAWLKVMAEGRMEAVQCDFAVMLSPDMFREFVLPDLRFTTERLDYSLYHLDGVEQMRFLDLLRECPRLNGIQWNPGSRHVGKLLPHLDAFRAIRQRGFSLLVPCANVPLEETLAMVRELGPDGLCLNLGHRASEGEALHIMERINKTCAG